MISGSARGVRFFFFVFFSGEAGEGTIVGAGARLPRVFKKEDFAHRREHKSTTPLVGVVDCIYRGQALFTVPAGARSAIQIQRRYRDRATPQIKAEAPLRQKRLSDKLFLN